MGQQIKILITVILMVMATTIPEKEVYAISSDYVAEVPPSYTPEIKQTKKAKPKPESIELPVCDVNADFASYMDYRTLTKRTSKQYALQGLSETKELGHRTHQEKKQIATHKQYGAIGDKITVTFEDNSQETFVIADHKANTDCSHPVGDTGRTSIIEMVVDTNKVERTDIRDGEIKRYSQKVIKIEKGKTE